MLTVEVDWTPTYELVASLKAYLARQHHKAMDLGPAWVAQVRKQISPHLAARLADAGELIYACDLELLIWQSPAKADPVGFLAWLESAPSGELFERLQPLLDPGEPLPMVLTQDRAPVASLLRDWHAEYFRSVDPAVLTGLGAEAERQRCAAAALDPVEAVERATGGMFIEAGPEPERIVLTPQYHFRPWNLYNYARGLRLFQYAADVLPPAPDAPSPQLLRLTRALSDENRLRILRYLAAGPRSLTEIVQETRLAKSTVHHHMVALRSAGLVRVHDTRAKADKFSLRPGCWNLISEALQTYLEGDTRA